jgi:hypothetical protein
VRVQLAFSPVKSGCFKLSATKRLLLQGLLPPSLRDSSPVNVLGLLQFDHINGLSLN